MFLYCLNEKNKEILLSKGFKLVNTTKGSEQNVYVFELNRGLINSDFSLNEVIKSCTLSDKLYMSF